MEPEHALMTCMWNLQAAQMEGFIIVSELPLLESFTGPQGHKAMHLQCGASA